jgi:hypothetical protein
MRLLLALIACCFATAAVAQSTGQSGETGTLIRRAPAQIDGRSPDAARRTMRDFGQCVVQRQPGVVRQVLAIPTSNEEYSSRLWGLATRDCISDGTLTIPLALMRSSLFEAVFIRDYGREPARDVSAVPALDIAAGYPEDKDETARSTLALAAFGMCVARASTQSSVDLMHSGIGSSSEGEIFARLNPVFAGCIPNGVTFRFSRSVLRGAIAEGLVRLYDSMGRPAS